MTEPPTPDLTSQLVIVTRLCEYCSFGGTPGDGNDPWEFMLRKLQDIEEPLMRLKNDLFQAAQKRLFLELQSGSLSAESCAGHKQSFESLLGPGDFADLAISLFPDTPDQEASLRRTLSRLEPVNPFQEERKPEEKRSPHWKKLVDGLYQRLEFDRLGGMLERRPGRPRRKAAALRRVRRDVAEYCTVVRIPLGPADTFTPFFLPRVEALVAANLRFLRRYR